VKKNWTIRIGFGVFITVLLIIGFLSVREIRRALILNQTHNEFKWIAMALHRYHDKHGHFPPPAILDKNEKKRHSWRSAIQLSGLPQRYEFGELWDSPANLENARHHQLSSSPYQFLAVVGPDAAWTEGETRTYKDFKDGLSNTILAIAVRNTGVSLYEPVDATAEGGKLFVRGEPLDTSRDVFILFADGRVQYFEEGIPPKNLAGWITIDGGEKVPAW